MSPAKKPAKESAKTARRSKVVGAAAKAMKATQSAKSAKAAKASGKHKAAAEPAQPAAVKTWNGKTLGSTSLDGSALGTKVKRRLLSTAVRMYEANERQGTLSTKTRGETNYTTRKPYKQKGTGNARRGDFNSPLLRGGGVIFGPRPRDFGFSMPRRALREALRTALAGKLRDGEIAVLQDLGLQAPSTKTAAGALAALGCNGRAAIVLPAENAVLYKSFRNLKGVRVVRAADLNAHDVLSNRHLVLVGDSWSRLTTRLGAAAPVAARGERS
ncbi:MAG: 50S ribosomal protein L4 [Planctomycetota bacterium]